jgi:hypothetical protein
MVESKECFLDCRQHSKIKCSPLLVALKRCLFSLFLQRKQNYFKTVTSPVRLGTTNTIHEVWYGRYLTLFWPEQPFTIQILQSCLELKCLLYLEFWGIFSLCVLSIVQSGVKVLWSERNCLPFFLARKKLFSHFFQFCNN